MTTDDEWRQWGIRDPYYGVLTNPQFRLEVLSPEAKKEFFDSGQRHVNYVLDTIRRHFDATFSPERVLDFGCGVGRALIPFAPLSREVVGMDIAEAMLAEARINCDRANVENVTLVGSDDLLSTVRGEFDLVHSLIVLQHLETVRGRSIFAELVRKISPGGYGAIHVTFGWTKYEDVYGQPPPFPIEAADSDNSPFRAIVDRWLKRLGLRHRPPEAMHPPDQIIGDPEMQMNYYNLSELMFIVHRAGVYQVFSDFTDHGGAIGVFLFFRKAA
jgi:SAM-dependent methyltransferase